MIFIHGVYTELIGKKNAKNGILKKKEGGKSTQNKANNNYNGKILAIAPPQWFYDSEPFLSG